MAGRATGYQSTGPFTADALLTDGNNATGYIVDVAGVAAEATVLVNLGPSPTAAASVDVTFLYNDVPSDPLIEGSNDGVSYTSVPPTSVPTLTFPTGSDITQSYNYPFASAVSYQYWRLCFRTNYVMGYATTRCGAMEVVLRDSGGIAIPEQATPVVVVGTPGHADSAANVGSPGYNKTVVGLAAHGVAYAPLGVGSAPRVIAGTGAFATAVANSGGGASARVIVGTPASASAVASAGAPMVAGSLKWLMCRDAAGSALTTEQSVANCDSRSAGGVWLGNAWGVLYSRWGTVYWRVTENSESWAGTTETAIGVSGRVRSVCINGASVILALVGAAFYSSGDRGATWVLRHTFSTAPSVIESVGDRFFALQLGTEGVRHFVSEDGGMSWR